MTFRSVLISLLAVALAACSPKSSDGSDSRPVLAVSIEPQRYLLERIAGDRMNVVTIMDKGAEPESFDPTVKAFRQLEHSAAYFVTGTNGFEQSMVRRLGERGPKVVDCSRGIELIGEACGHDHDGPYHEHADPHGEYDPHIWTSVRNARIMSRNMLQALVAIDPSGADYYRERYARLDAGLDSLDHQLDSVLAPVRGESFLVWHPSLGYFARDYGLHQVAIGEEHKEMSAKTYAAKIDLARNTGARMLLVQPEYDRARSLTLARQAGATPVEINLLTYDWADQLKALAEALTEP